MQNLREKVNYYFTELHQETKESMKPYFKEFLRKINPNEDYDFNLAVKIGLCYVSMYDFAHQFGAELPSVREWESGENHPHLAMRSPVLEWIIKKIEDE